MSSVQDPSSLAKNLTEVVLTEAEVSLLRQRLRSPQLALRSDGELILSIADLPPGTDLSHRQVWSGVLLTSPERELLNHRFANAEAEVAARLVVLIANPTPENEPNPAE